ncbi:bile acid:sodium symporter [Bartonella sp. M0177]|uniref:bile acid:sodium symporter family protein n=1 Tax=Bartonella sp. M0177 TaxID=2750940 RepID=UPI0018DC3780|nr:bile acid:sodium symporter family protein [Bartonella sp. M0177]MBI0003451.1 bile acid:sodium symporter [Bartonella sp. M0177]
MKFLPDKFLTALIVAIIIASIAPISGKAADWFSLLTQIFVGLLFFLHGAKLPWQAVLAGIVHWRLHLTVFLATFVLFPILGVLAGIIVPGLKESAFYAGILYLCVLPSTVQSSIAFTSIAGGNIPAAIVSASASNIFGMFLTPLLVGLLFSAGGGKATISATAFESILVQLLIPFVLGQLCQRFIGNFIVRHKSLTSIVDRGSIILVVYLAFSEATTSGLWHTTSWHELIVMIIIDVVLLAIVLTVTWYGSKLLGFDEKDCITITFCGSKKSLASGAPMANAIFAGSGGAIGAIVLPLMLFHQIQLMVCTIIARHLSERRKQSGTDE